MDFSVAGRVLKKFSVGGLGSTEVVDNNSINIEYGRNTTHLHFKVYMITRCVYSMYVTCTCMNSEWREMERGKERKGKGEKEREGGGKQCQYFVSVLPTCIGGIQELFDLAHP